MVAALRVKEFQEAGHLVLRLGEARAKQADRGCLIQSDTVVCQSTTSPDTKTITNLLKLQKRTELIDQRHPQLGLEPIDAFSGHAGGQPRPCIAAWCDGEAQGSDHVGHQAGSSHSCWSRLFQGLQDAASKLAARSHRPQAVMCDLLEASRGVSSR